MNRKTLWLATAVFAAAALAVGQNADRNTAGPTKNDYRLRVSEPREGATISGSTVQVVVNTEIPGESPEEQRKTTFSPTNVMPRPDVDVFLDGQNKGKIKGADNVITIDGLAAGEHKLVLLAMNRSGEVIDRKEIRFTSTATVASATETSSTTTRATTYTAQSQSAAPSAPAYEPSQAQKPSAAYEAPPAPGRPSTLPQTGTPYPALFAGGLILALAGLGLKSMR